MRPLLDIFGWQTLEVKGQEEEVMICPSCSGNKKIIAFVHRKKHYEFIALSCPDCDASGKVNNRYPQWKVLGEKLKNARIARRETLRLFCRRTGADPALRGKMERGFADPSGVEP